MIRISSLIYYTSFLFMQGAYAQQVPVCVQLDHITAYSEQWTNTLTTAKHKKMFVIGSGVLLATSLAAWMYVQNKKTLPDTPVNDQGASRPERNVGDANLLIAERIERLERPTEWKRPMIDGIQQGLLFGIAGFVYKTIDSSQSAALQRLKAFGFFDPSRELFIHLQAMFKQASFVNESLLLLRTYAKPVADQPHIMMYQQLHHNMVQNIICSQQSFVQSLEQVIGFFTAMVVYHYGDDNQEKVRPFLSMMDKFVSQANDLCGQLDLLCQGADGAGVDECLVNVSAFENLIKQYLCKTYYDLFSTNIHEGL